jgi:hypothetical protein
MFKALLPFANKVLDKVIPDPTVKAQAQLELAKLASEGKLAEMANETELYKSEQEGITSRWNADMASDSRLSKNIRPLTLVYILTAYLGMVCLFWWTHS